MSVVLSVFKDEQKLTHVHVTCIISTTFVLLLCVVGVETFLFITFLLSTSLVVILSLMQDTADILKI